jgi:hypothetical protein
MLQANRMRDANALNARWLKFDLAQMYFAKERLAFAKTQQAGHLDERDNPAGRRVAGAGLAGQPALRPDE